MKKQLLTVTVLTVGLVAGSNVSAGTSWGVSVGVGGPGYAGTITVGSPAVRVCQPAPVRVAPTVVYGSPVVYVPAPVVCAPTPVVYAPAPVVYAAPYGWARPVVVAVPHGRPMGHGPGYPPHHYYGRR